MRGGMMAEVMAFGQQARSCPIAELCPITRLRLITSLVTSWITSWITRSVTRLVRSAA